MNTLDNVTEFHRAFDCTISESPCIPPSPNVALLRATAAVLQECRAQLREKSSSDLSCLRAALTVEETAEEITALANGDVKALLDAYADKDYIDKGSILSFGLQDVFEEACRRVHQSNMSKLVDGKPVKDVSGKVTKGPNYKPVDLTDLVDGSWLKAQREA